MYSAQNLSIYIVSYNRKLLTNISQNKRICNSIVPKYLLMDLQESCAALLLVYCRALSHIHYYLFSVLDFCKEYVFGEIMRHMYLHRSIIWMMAQPTTKLSCGLILFQLHYVVMNKVPFNITMKILKEILFFRYKIRQ